MGLFVLTVAILLGAYMAWGIGANDVANSMADAVGSRSITIKKAVILAAVCEFSGSVLVGAHVTNTIRKGIISPDVVSHTPMAFALAMICALAGAALWLHFATWWGMPVSTTHSIVGAVAGVGILAGGFSAIDYARMGQIIASWFISPIVGGVMAFFTFRLIVRFILGTHTPIRSAIRFAPVLIFFVGFVMSLATLYKGLKHVLGHYTFLSDHAIAISLGVAFVSALLSRVFLKRSLMNDHHKPVADQLLRVEAVLAPVVVITSCCVAFAHGANDVANAVGPLAAVVDVVGTGAIKKSVEVPLWVLCLGGAGIVVGLATYGYRVIETVGTRITVLTPSRGIAADVAATTMVLVCSRLGLPVSTTHTLVGSIIGVGLARGLSAVNRRVTYNIFWSWLVTLPAAGGVAVVLFLVLRWLFHV